MTTTEINNTTAQHTPGPWHVECSAEITVRTDNGGIVATMTANWTPRDADREANARLIAAAPDLLAALEDMQRAYQQMFDVMPVAWQTYDDIVSAAIAKARGL